MSVNPTQATLQTPLHDLELDSGQSKQRIRAFKPLRSELVTLSSSGEIAPKLRNAPEILLPYMNWRIESLQLAQTAAKNKRKHKLWRSEQAVWQAVGGGKVLGLVPRVLADDAKRRETNAAKKIEEHIKRVREAAADIDRALTLLAEAGFEVEEALYTKYFLPPTLPRQKTAKTAAGSRRTKKKSEDYHNLIKKCILDVVNHVKNEKGKTNYGVENVEYSEAAVFIRVGKDAKDHAVLPRGFRTRIETRDFKGTLFGFFEFEERQQRAEQSRKDKTALKPTDFRKNFINVFTGVRNELAGCTKPNTK